MSLQEFVTPTEQPRLRSEAPAKRAPHSWVAKPALILLGGEVNALSIARSLSAAGVDVYALNEPGSPLRYSRHCRWIKTEPRQLITDAWAEYLLGPASDHLQGSVLLAASDDAIELIARHRNALEEKFLLDDSNPQAQLCMLNKLQTYRAARSAGVPTPRFWSASSLQQVEAVRDELVYPLLIKPELSHVFFARFHKKYLVVNNYGELVNTLKQLADTNIEFLLMEYIEGADDQLCSYYTYLDADGIPLFHFSKRVIRRYPIHEGITCYHVTDHNDEVQELSLQLFASAGLRGLANAEFKRDARDGKLKLIECNARFTAANGLVAESGFDLGRFVYSRLIGQPQADMLEYQDEMRLWYPLEDFLAFCQLYRRGELTFSQWLKSLMHRKLLPVFRWTDPLPSLVGSCDRIHRYLKKLFVTEPQGGQQQGSTAAVRPTRQNT